MSERVTSDEAILGNSARLRKKWRSVAGRVLLAILVLITIVEAHAKLGYDHTLATLRANATKVIGEPIIGDEAEVEAWSLPLAEAEKCIKGFPSRHHGFRLQTPIVLFKWFSLFKTYVIQLGLDSGDIVVSLSTEDLDLAQFPDRPQSAAEFLDSVGIPVSLHAGITAGHPGTLQLEYVVPPEKERQAGYFVSLKRELFRQSLLIAARDELGLATRDKNFGERILRVRQPKTVPLNLVVYASADAPSVQLDLHEWQDDSIRLIDQLNAPLTHDAPLEAFVAEAERFSRTTFVEILKRQHYSGQRNPRRPAGPTPTDVPSLLSRKTFPSTVAALRILHRLLHDDGESPDRLADLAFGYAMLAELNSLGYSPAQEVCRARALIYAERLVVQFPDDPQAYWGRARVRGMVGRHLASKQDLAEADKKNASWKPTPLSPPAWTALIRRFVIGEHEVTREATSESMCDAAMIDLLEWQMSAAIGDELREDAVLSRMPWLTGDHTYPAKSGLESVIKLFTNEDPKRSLGGRTQTFSEQLEVLPQLPETLKKVQSEIKTMPDQFQARQRLIGALDAFSDPEQDHQEPSLAALAGVLRELTFDDARTAVLMTANFNSSETDKTLDRWMPLIQSHPATIHLEVLRRDRERSGKALVETMEAHIWSAMNKNYFWALEYSRRAGHIGASREDLVRQLFGTTAPLFADLLWVLRSHPSVKRQRDAARQLFQICPDSPLTVAAMIDHDWPAVQHRADEWETRFSNSAEVQTALGAAFRRSLEYHSAARCLRQASQRQGSPRVYEQLARLAIDQDDEVTWRSAREAVFRVSKGTRFGQVNALMETSRQLLSRNNPRDALTYATQAAEYPTEESLDLLSKCNEALGDWAAAERYQEEIARKFGHRWKWYFWCQRTGRGNIEAAEKWMEDEGWLQQFLEAPHENDRLVVATYALFRDDFETAVERLSERWGVPSHELRYYYRGIFAHVNRIILKEQIGTLVVQEEWKKTAGVNRFAHRFEIPDQSLSFGNELRNYYHSAAPRKLDVERLHWILLCDDVPEVRTRTLFLIGRLLLSEKQEAEAIPYLRLAATAPITDHIAHIASCMAGHALRKLGQPVDTLRGTELSESEARLVERLDIARFWYDLDDFERVHAVCANLDVMHAGWAPALALRGKAYFVEKNFIEAEKYFTLALAKAPRIPELYWRRGQVHLATAKYRDAIVDFQHALDLDPRNEEAHWGLAMILAAAPDDNIRDPQASVKHAESIDPDRCVAEPWLYEAIAAAYAGTGDFSKAVQFSEWTYVGPTVEDRNRIDERTEQFRQKREFRLPRSQ